MSASERDNPSLKGVLPTDCARPGLDKQRLGQIINLVSDIAMGSAADRAKDTLGRLKKLRPRGCDGPATIEVRYRERPTVRRTRGRR